MNIDAVFIPCAGYGTRMGKIGKIIPKPLWTIGGVPLLYLKILQYSELGFNTFVLNSHHQADKIDSFAAEHNLTIVVSNEPQILGNGGSFHKLKRDLPELNKVLVTNPDSFYFLSKKDWNNFTNLSENVNNCLLGVRCKSTDTYNRLKLENNLFQKVEMFGKETLSSDLTYGGMGIVDLNSFPNKEGESSFFETVVNPLLNITEIKTPNDSYEFYDFGTLSEFINLSLKVLEGGEMLSLLNRAWLKMGIKSSIGENLIREKRVKDIYGDKTEYLLD